MKVGIRGPRRVRGPSNGDPPTGRIKIEQMADVRVGSFR
jgi:hypothetical protein